MMMAALEAGGVPIAHDSARDRLSEMNSDTAYRPNPDDHLYELPAVQMRAAGFPREHDGKAIKCVVQSLPLLAVHRYRIVMMLRDPEEIRQSYEAAFRQRLPAQFVKQYESRMDEARLALENRKDVMSLDVMQYRGVVEHPHKAVATLVDNDWPILFPEAAAKTIHSAQCRFKAEELTVGL